AAGRLRERPTLPGRTAHSMPGPPGPSELTRERMPAKTAALARIRLAKSRSHRATRWSAESARAAPHLPSIRRSAGRRAVSLPLRSDPAGAEQRVGERDQARPAKAADAPTANHGKLDRAALAIDDRAVDCAAVGAHAAADAAAFERGAGAARAGERELGVSKDDLAVRPQVHV